MFRLFAAVAITCGCGATDITPSGGNTSDGAGTGGVSHHAHASSGGTIASTTQGPIPGSSGGSSTGSSASPQFGTGGAVIGSGGTRAVVAAGGATTIGAGGVSTGAGGTSISAGGTSVGAGGASAGAGGANGGVAGGTTGSGGFTDGPDWWQPIIPPTDGNCPIWQNETITFDGLSGIRIEAGPKPSNPTAPMLVYWHGTGSNSDEYLTMAKPVADGVTQAGGIIVSFEGTTGGDLYSGTSIFGEGDLKLVDGLVACAVKDHNVDPRQIYTMGCSAGGIFAVSMAILRSSYVAAVAPNSGGVVAVPMFQNGHAPSLMTVHGVEPEGDIVNFADASATADKLFKNKDGFVIDCDTGAGHCGGAPLAADVWKFFQAHPFGVVPEPWTSGLPLGFSSQCKIQ